MEEKIINLCVHSLLVISITVGSGVLLMAYADYRSGYWSAPIEMTEKVDYCE